MIIKATSKKILTSILVGLFLFALFVVPLDYVSAETSYVFQNTEADSVAANTAYDVRNEAAQKAIAECSLPASQLCTGLATSWTCTEGLSSMNKCMAAAELKNASLVLTSDWQRLTTEFKDAERKEAIKTALAKAFKSSLSVFTRTLVHDTAVWVASGGKGQKPLFITEGWGAYLTNTADVALGDFIDGVGSVFGMDLCQPDFRVRLAITGGLDYRQQKAVRCSLSKITTNWQSAISNVDFALDYKSSLKPGENDITFALMMADSRTSYVGNAVQAATKAAEGNGLFTDIKNIAGNILTPGTFVKEQLFGAMAKSDKGMDVFTGTIADTIEEFLNTLVSQLLKNMQSGFFASAGGASKDKNGINLADLAGLFDYNSSPVVSSVKGALNVFAKLVTSQEKFGDRFDILAKLSTCSDSAKDNPGPTDCVIDQTMLQAIKSRKYVKQLEEYSIGDNNKTVLDRTFSSQIQSSNLSSDIPYRSILIMRKYRIVPVGWEIAAKMIQDKNYKNPFNDKTINSVRNYSLREIMNGFNSSTSEFYGLVDPYWALKSYETYCRRQSYGAQNTTQGDQSLGITRSEYCSDEQQCLFDDSKGNCQFFGYCYEERKKWDLGESCEPRDNTCQTYQSRTGVTGSYLTNTLDFATCSSDNAGCRSFATLFNPISNNWNGDIVTSTNILKRHVIYSDDNDITGSGLVIEAGHYMSSDSLLQLSSPCSKDLCGRLAASSGCSWNQTSQKCTFGAQICRLPAGSISCLTNSCYNSNSILTSSFNPGFETAVPGINLADADKWTDETSAYDPFNRHSRVPGMGRSGSALRAKSTGANLVTLITSLPNIPVTASSSYRLTFWARGFVDSGSVWVKFFEGAPNLNDLSSSDGSRLTTVNVGSASGWVKYTATIDTRTKSTGTLAIITTENTKADVYFDDFEMNQIKADCASDSVRLFTPLSAGTVSATNKYFDKDAETCSASAEGCTEFIRAKAGKGSNLIYNGGFEYGLDSWRGSDINLDNSAKPKVVWNGNAINATAFKTTLVEGGQYYAISLYGAQVSSTNNNTVRLEMSFFDKNNADSNPIWQTTTTNCWVANDLTIANSSTPAGTDWERKSCWFKAPVVATKVGFKLFAGNVNPSEAYVKDIKLEKVSSAAAAYSTPYNATDRTSLVNTTNLKKAPNYLNCYKEAGLWATSSTLLTILNQRRPECVNFANVCTKDEVDCELYTPVTADPSVPGVVTDSDLCNKECVGYQNYKQEATYFVSSTFQNFIADSKAKYCSASNAGCDEFTNLDNLAGGAENKEYYSQIKACQRTTDDNAANYYTWEGSDVTGYQLKVFRLRSDLVTAGVAGVGAPCSNLIYSSSGTPLCSNIEPASTSTADMTAVGWCTAEDMAINPDCRQLYNSAGAIFYRLLSMTVTVSDNCHPYRRTATTLTGSAECSSHHGYFNSNGECIYMAVPQEGRTCSATAKGCRAYVGNQGNNVRNVINSNFEDLSFAGWVNQASTTANLFVAPVATYVGGSSLSNRNPSGDGGATTLKHPVILKQNRAYTLSFWAKGTTTGNVGFNISNTSIKFSGFADAFVGRGTALEVPPLSVDATWRKYDLGPVFFTGTPAADQFLEISGIPSAATIYLDNIILKESQSNIYAIENSWFTPLSCDNKREDPDGTKAKAGQGELDCNEGDPASGRCYPQEMLGCQAYTDRAGNLWPIKSFQSLCRREAVGCEALVDTKNSVSDQASTFNTSNSSAFDNVTTTADEMVYLVNDAKFSCQNTDKGCTKMGLPTVDKFDQIISYRDVFLKDNPDKYNTIMCKHEELWCEQYSSTNSVKYFKDPHSKFCSFGQPAGGGTAGWYKDGTSEPCDITANQSFGTGYDANINKLQPVGPWDNAIQAQNNSNYKGWVGTCAAESSGCSEYVDTKSSSSERVYPSLVTDANATSIKLEANKLYYFSKDFAAGVTGPSGVCQYKNIDTWTSSTEISKGKLVYLTSSEQYCTVTRSTAIGTTVVAYGGVYYAMAGATDRSSCNGLYGFDNNCILFNDRSDMNYNATDPAKRYSAGLIYNSEQTVDGQAPSVANPVQDANLVLKVTPDRACQRWIDCTSYEKSAGDSNLSFSFKDKCLNIDGCDSFDANGQCQHRPATTTYAINSSNLSKASTLSGFADDRGSFLNFAQSGNSANLGNGNFEREFNGTKEPVGWLRGLYNCTGTNCSSGNPQAVDLPWNATLYSIENSISTAHEGVGYLKLNGKSAVVSEVVDVLPGKTYTLTAWVNTKALLGSDNTNVRGEIQIQTLTDTNTPTSFNVPVGTGWTYNNALRLNKGNDWTKLSYTFTTPAGTNKIKVAIFNMNPNSDGSGYDNAKLGGYTLWDDISIKPVLLNSSIATDVTARTCRAYPGAQATACQYSDTSKAYYGQYGYCMTVDPFNKQQCLQWWPVDSIAGDIASDYSGFYQDRAPLYYCIEKKYYQKDFAAVMTRLGAFGETGQGLGSNLKLDRYGTGIRLTDFSVDDAWRPLFRYPFIYRFDFNGVMAAIGSTASSKFFAATVSAIMYPKAVCAGVAGKFGSLFSGGGINPLCWILDNNPRLPDASFNDATCAKNAKNPDVTCNTGNDFICRADDGRYMSSACGTAQLGHLDKAGADGTRCENDNFKNFNDVCDPNNPLTNCGFDSDLSDDDVALFDRYECDMSGNSWIKKTWDKFTSWISGLWDSIKPQFKEEDVWGGWGAIGTPVPNIPVVIVNAKMPWNAAKAISPGVGTGLVSLLTNVLDAVLNLGGADAKLFISTMGVKIITDQDVEMGDSMTDPDPNNSGDILGYADFWNSITFQDYGDKTGFAILTGGFTAKSQVGYCSKIVQVVESSGANKAWTSRLSANSGYTLTDVADCILDSEKDASSTSYVGAVNKEMCFATSKYCMSGKTLDPNVPANLCSNLIGPSPAVYPEDKQYNLTCQGDEDIYGQVIHSGDVAPEFYAVRANNPSNGTFFYAKNYFCKKFGNGSNSAYVFKAIATAWDYTYSGTDFPPFGSIVAPATDQYPSSWDGRKTGVGPGDTATSNLTINTQQYINQDISLSLSTNDGKQPLYYEIPFGKTAPYQARMGQVHSATDLQKLFARSYGYWEFVPDNGTGKFGDQTLFNGMKESGRYIASSTGVGLWGLPVNYCLNGSTDVYNRSSMADEYCKIKPKIANIMACNNEKCGTASGSASNATLPNSSLEISKSTPIKLTFTVAIDPDQLPIRAMEVNWDDGSVTTYSGAALLDRPSSSTPFSFYHYYDYSKAKANCGDKCNITIKITDNWNAENAISTTYYNIPVTQ